MGLLPMRTTGMRMWKVNSIEIVVLLTKPIEMRIMTVLEKSIEMVLEANLFEIVVLLIKPIEMTVLSVISIEMMMMMMELSHC